jgi:mRNA-decapping enzyme subunit 2
MTDMKDNVVVNSSKKRSSGNSVVGDGPPSKGPNKHEKQQQQQQRNSGSRGKPKSQNRRSTPPPRAGSTSSSRGGSTGRGRCRGGSGEETTVVVVSASDPLVKSALAAPGESGRWTEDEMFAANEKLSGRKITYDGNPHEFAAGGWGSGIVRDGNHHNEEDNDEGRGCVAIVDPHAFHIVGGSFMNSEAPAAGTVASSLIAPPPEASKLQTLVNARAMTPGSIGEGDDGLELTPFFSNDGRAPWEGENNTCVRGTNICASKDLSLPSVSVQGPPPGRKNSKGLALLNRLRQGGCANDDEAKEERRGAEQIHVAMMADMTDTNDIDEWFMTDREITAKSQSKKLSLISRAPEPVLVPTSSPHVSHQWIEDEVSPNIINEHLVWMKNWAQKLPKARPTKVFGDFRLDIDSILNVATVAQKGSN